MECYWKYALIRLLISQFPHIADSNPKPATVLGVGVDFWFV